MGPPRLRLRRDWEASHILSRSRAAFAVGALLLPALVFTVASPTAEARTLYLESFEGDVSGWGTVGGLTRQCRSGISGCYAEVVNQIGRAVPVQLESLGGISFYTRPSSLGFPILGDPRTSTFALRFSNGAQSVLDFEDPDTASLVTIDGVPFYNLPESDVWYRVVYRFDVTGHFTVEIRDSADALLAISPAARIPSASALTHIFIAVRGMDVDYDEIRIVGGLEGSISFGYPALSYWVNGLKCNAIVLVCGNYVLAATLVPSSLGAKLDVRAQAISGTAAASDVIGIMYANQTLALEARSPPGTPTSAATYDFSIAFSGTDFQPLPIRGTFLDLAPCRRVTAEATFSAGGGGQIVGFRYGQGPTLSEREAVYLAAPLASPLTGATASVAYDPCRAGERRLAHHVQLSLPTGVHRVAPLLVGGVRAELDGLPDSLDVEWEVTAMPGGVKSIEVDVDLPFTGSERVQGWVEPGGAGRVVFDRVPRDVHVVAVEGPGGPRTIRVETDASPAGGAVFGYSRYGTEDGLNVDVRASAITRADLLLDLVARRIDGAVDFVTGQGAVSLAMLQWNELGAIEWQIGATLSTLTRLDLDLAVGEDIVIDHVDITATSKAASLFTLTLPEVGDLRAEGLPTRLAGTVDRTTSGSLLGVALEATGGVDRVTWTGTAGKESELKSLSVTKLTRLAFQSLPFGGIAVSDASFLAQSGTMSGFLTSRTSYDSRGWNRFETTLTGEGLTRVQYWNRVDDPNVRASAELSRTGKLAAHVYQTESGIPGLRTFDLEIRRAAAGSAYILHFPYFPDEPVVSPGSCYFVDYKSVPFVGGPYVRLCGARWE